MGSDGEKRFLCLSPLHWQWRLVRRTRTLPKESQRTPSHSYRAKTLTDLIWQTYIPAYVLEISNLTVTKKTSNLSAWSGWCCEQAAQIQWGVKALTTLSEWLREPHLNRPLPPHAGPIRRGRTLPDALAQCCRLATPAPLLLTLSEYLRPSVMS